MALNFILLMLFKYSNLVFQHCKTYNERTHYQKKFEETAGCTI